MAPLLERVTVLCFGASYTVALALEILQLLRPRRIQRLLALGFGIAGLLAHTIYVAIQPLELGSPFGSLLFLAWILAVFYLYGSIHHRRLAWGAFVLPLVLGLVLLARLFPPKTDPRENAPVWSLFSYQGERFWGLVHGTLVLLAAVGVCVGFVASVMYLVQVRRLRKKTLPGRGMKLLSLERLEAMNRRAIILAFPLLTAGLLVGIGLMLHGGEPLGDWSSPKVLSALGLWLVFAILLYLRYGFHARGRQVALLTIVAFALLLVTLAAPVHPFVGGGMP
jgi:ABC-type transport system involved in cytochrome c biogenesis permease subunit